MPTVIIAILVLAYIIPLKITEVTTYIYFGPTNDEIRTNIQAFGAYLYTAYSQLIAIISFILLVAMIGAICITRQYSGPLLGSTNHKQDISTQISRNYFIKEKDLLGYSATNHKFIYDDYSNLGDLEYIIKSKAPEADLGETVSEAPALDQDHIEHQLTNLKE